MTKAISVFHGHFGRATLFHLDRAIIPHTHREGHLLFHICGSQGSLFIDGVEYPVTPDMAVAVNPWEIHEYRPADANGQFIIVLYVKPSWFSMRHQGSGGRLRFGMPQFEITQPISFRISQLTELLAGKAGADQLDQLLYELTYECSSASQAKVETFGYSLLDMRNNDYRVRKSMTLMSQRLDQEPDVSKLAMDSGLSRPHFFKLFRSQIGVTPKLFWNTLRLEKAFDVLVETSRPICDISMELGFSSQSSFSRFFCMNTGMAPTDYRRVGHLAPDLLAAA